MCAIMKQRAGPSGDCTTFAAARADRAAAFPMTPFPFAIFAVAAVMAGCAQPGTMADARGSQIAQAGQSVAASAPAEPKAKSAKPAVRPALPNLELTEQLMFKLMLAEVAEQRGQLQ